MIADISGYTKFMMKSQKNLEHAQVVISELISAIIERIDIPVEISKLEGDAVFMFSELKDDENSKSKVYNEIGRMILEFFDVFAEKIVELVESNVCDCEVCNSISKLRLKLFVHKGECLIYNLKQWKELAGVDVITIHRLLKNSVQSNEYILVTENIHDMINFPPELEFRQIKEKYDDIGSISCFVSEHPKMQEIHASKEHSGHYHSQSIAKGKYRNLTSKMKDLYRKMFKSKFISKKNTYFYNDSNHDIHNYKEKTND